MVSRTTENDCEESRALRIGEAGSKGKGVFAATRIEPSELVWDYAGEEKWIEEIPSQLWPHCFQVDYDRYVVPKEGSAGWFMNHSCGPNCVIMGKTRVVALRRIEPGEEVTFDYSTNVGWDGFSMECRCGTKGCRKTIKSYRFLPDDLKGNYGACVSEFLLRPTKPDSGAPVSQH
ncbi:MAG: SET domain-containing protein-lysine N-methyltransferase [Thaumarchaeota archaeon]|nr:SET domain-containing protein-lysine N-methyltransferase [Nitrososphaerota archaeon]